MPPKDATGNANSGYSEEQSNLGLHCLPRPICLKTLDNYGKKFPILCGADRKNNPQLICIFVFHMIF